MTIDQKITDIVKEFMNRVTDNTSPAGSYYKEIKVTNVNWLKGTVETALQSIAKLAREEGQRSVGIIGAYDAIVEQARKDGRELERTEKIEYDKEGWREEIDEAEKRGRELGRKELLEKLPKEKEVRKDLILISSPDIALKQVVNEGYNSALKEVRKIILYE